MCSINIDGLVQREECIATINRAVDSAIELCDTGLCQARNKFLDITNSRGSACRLARAKAIPELYILQVNRLTTPMC